MVLSALVTGVVGLVLYFVLANIVDGLVFRVAMGAGDRLAVYVAVVR